MLLDVWLQPHFYSWMCGFSLTFTLGCVASASLLLFGCVASASPLGFDALIGTTRVKIP